MIVGNEPVATEIWSASYYRARYYDPTIGRFTGEDPQGFEEGEDFYTYVLNSLPNSIDPSGLKTTVVIIYDNGWFGFVYGSHAALYIDNGGDPILYDPAGGYAPKHNCGSGQACDGYAADLSKFKKHHQGGADFHSIQFFTFDTTPEEEKQIAERIKEIGGAAPLFCAASVSGAISGIGPFKKLKGDMAPGNLAAELNNILNPPKPHGGKK